MDDADQRLPRGERAHDVGAEGLLAHVRDELLDDRQCDVGLEQRKTNLAQRVLDVGFGEPGLAAQLLDDATEALGEVVEHGVMRRRRCGGSPPGGAHER